MINLHLEMYRSISTHAHTGISVYINTHIGLRIKHKSYTMTYTSGTLIMNNTGVINGC